MLISVNAAVKENAVELVPIGTPLIYKALSPVLYAKAIFRFPNTVPDAAIKKAGDGPDVYTVA